MKDRQTNAQQYTMAEFPQRGFKQNRLQNFGWTMTVMGISFIAYYLGLFGGIEGPLAPDKIGERMAAAGFSNRHLLFFLISCMGIALIWNWLYNAVCLLLNRRMKCAWRLADEGCQAPARRDGAGGYVCSAGHRHQQVRFQAVKKGTVAHFLWMMFLVFSGIVLYLSR